MRAAFIVQVIRGSLSQLACGPHEVAYSKKDNHLGSAHFLFDVTFIDHTMHTLRIHFARQAGELHHVTCHFHTKRRFVAAGWLCCRLWATRMRSGIEWWWNYGGTKLIHY